MHRVLPRSKHGGPKKSQEDTPASWKEVDMQIHLGIMRSELRSTWWCCRIPCGAEKATLPTPQQPQPPSGAEDMQGPSEEEVIHNIVRVSHYKLHGSSSSLVVLSQSVRRRPNHPSGGLAAPTTTQRIYLDAIGGRDEHGVVKKLLSKLRRPSLASSLLVLQHSWRRDHPPPQHSPQHPN